MRVIIIFNEKNWICLHSISTIFIWFYSSLVSSLEAWSTAILDAGLARPISLAFLMIYQSTSSPVKVATFCPTTPLNVFDYLTTAPLVEQAKMRTSGLYLETNLGSLPVSAQIIMREMSLWSSTALQIVAEITSAVGMGWEVPALTSLKALLQSIVFSASVQILAMIYNASTGQSPVALSFESMRQSLPSITALATSEASGLVGFKVLLMDPSISVALMICFD